MAEAVVHVEPGKEVAPLYCGVDVGGTNIKIGLVDDLGQTLLHRSLATHQERGPADAMARVSKTIEEMVASVGYSMEEIAAIGLATPGTMDIQRGILLEPHNLPEWFYFPIQTCLADLTSRPVIFANDANAAAFGEYWVGSGKQFRSSVLLTIGTGVGGGIIVDNLLIEGEHSHGSELGHIIIDFSDDARQIPTGQKGHLEAYASGTAIIKRTIEALADAPDSSLQARVQAGEEVSPLMVSEEAEKGDKFAMHIVLETARFLGIGIVSLMHTIDPGAVILGGAINFGGRQSKVGQAFLQRIKDEVKIRAFPVPAEKTVIDFASLGGAAGYLGAAGTARNACRRDSPK